MACVVKGTVKSISSPKLYDLSYSSIFSTIIFYIKLRYFLFYKTLLISSMAHWNIAWCQIENMSGIDDNLLSKTAVRNALWEVNMPVHKTMSLRILIDKDEAKKNGKNTGSCWTSERRIERVSLLFWKTSGKK